VTESGPRKWAFKARLRRHAFGWRSQPAIERVRQAVAEIKKVARKDPVVAAEGAVAFLERISPAIEHVDGSSGAIGSVVNNAIAELVPVIANAPADPKIRAGWLERLFEAHAEDQIPYIESLADHWGELCASKEVASEWADRLIGITRMALSPDESARGCFHGTTMCLTALYAAGRYDELLDLLADLVKTTPGDEGKWFAAAKDAGLFDEALALAARTPCDPKTLTRAARDYAGNQPAFALGAGLLALYWLAHGCGYEITSADVWAAYLSTMKVAEQMGKAGQVRQDIRRTATSVEPGANFVARILDRKLGLP
jgi:hypothetical protein